MGDVGDTGLPFLPPPPASFTTNYHTYPLIESHVPTKHRHILPHQPPRKVRLHGRSEEKQHGGRKNENENGERKGKWRKEGRKERTKMEGDRFLWSIFFGNASLFVPFPSHCQPSQHFRTAARSLAYAGMPPPRGVGGGGGSGAGGSICFMKGGDMIDTHWGKKRLTRQ
jgi:hypothetical protein